MKKIYQLLFVLSLMAVFLNAEVTKLDKNNTIVKHSIQSGDTLLSLAEQYHSTVVEIKAKNHLEENEILKLERILEIPINTYFPKKKEVITLAKDAKSKYSKAKLVVHTIGEGETLFTVAKKYHSTSKEIQQENGLEKDQMLNIGQMIVVPINTYFPKKKEVITLAKDAKSKYSKAKLVVHTIGEGETLFTVAKKYHSTSKEIQQENGLEKDQMLNIGQMIVVPINTYFPKKKEVITLAKDAKSKYSKAKLVTHTIEEGETLFTIARKHHTTMDEVAKENSLKEGEMLKLGRVLIVPTNTYSYMDKKSLIIKKSSQAKKIKFVKHSIKEGETLFIIARKHHTTIAEIQKENALKKGEVLKLGRMLIVPKNTYSPKKIASIKKSKQKPKVKIVKHKIKAGETLFTIAQKHKTTISEVRRKNKLKQGDVLKLGRILQVPSNTHKTPKIRMAKQSHKKLKPKRKRKIAKKKIKQNKVISLAKIDKIIVNKNNIITHRRQNSYRSRQSKITSIAKKKLGRRYVWGASGTKNTYDCSSFTKYVYRKNGINIPRTSINQSKFGKRVKRKNLKKGDLIFFDTSKRHKGYVNHVGIYLGNGRFIHASSAKKKVVISKLAKFYAQRYRGARRPS